ncbi:OmpA family protein [Thalassospira mesophila]|uniref:OmpA family protein n=1 Tax=Thalassospira mesophila TaxID=1293891 RepID=UPI000A1E71D3|nr:OmpA family protein [Thalassospira mesophila]
MKGNTKISAIAFAAALGTLMVASNGASARQFSPVLPGSNVQVDWGVLDQLGNGQTGAQNLSPSTQDANPRIKIASQLLIYPQSPPKSRFMAPQLLLTPPVDHSRFGTQSTFSSNNDTADLETVVIDGAGIVPGTEPQNREPGVILHPPGDRVQLRAPVSFPSRPAVEQITPARATGNLGGTLHSDIDDDGAHQVIHLIQPAPASAPAPALAARQLDESPRAKPVEPASTTDSSATSQAPAPQTAPMTTPVASPVAAPVKVVQVAYNDTKPANPVAPKITAPHLDTPREAPKNKMAVPPVKSVPLPDKNIPKPATKPQDNPSLSPEPLQKDNAVPTLPGPTPDTTTPPQKMPDQKSQVIPKPPAPKPAAQKAQPQPAPQPQSRLQPRETASAPASLAMGDAKNASVASGDYSLPFAENSFELDNNVKKRLDTIVGTLTKNDDLRVQLQAYAAGESQNASKARRLSLSRALQVRSYLIDGGVRSTRIDVRALGANVPSGPADRVDVKTVQR